MELTQEQYDQLPDFMKAHYTKGDNGMFVMKGGDDVGALKRAKDHEVEKRKKAVEKQKAAEDALKAYEDAKSAADEDGLKRTGDLEALEKSYKEKIDKINGEKDSTIAKLKETLSTFLVDNVAQSVAESISTEPHLMLPFVKQRLVADLDGDTPSTRILDAEGQISALNIDDLKAEFQSNKGFKKILIASKASGGGPDTEQVSQKSFSTSGGEAPTSLSDLSDEALAEHITQMREEQKQ